MKTMTLREQERRWKLLVIVSDINLLTLLKS